MFFIYGFKLLDFSREYDEILSEKEKNNTSYNQMSTKNAAYAEELKQVNNKRKKVKDQLKLEEKKVTQSFSRIICFMYIKFKVILWIFICNFSYSLSTYSRISAI